MTYYLVDADISCYLVENLPLIAILHLATLNSYLNKLILNTPLMKELDILRDVAHKLKECHQNDTSLV